MARLKVVLDRHVHWVDTDLVKYVIPSEVALVRAASHHDGSTARGCRSARGLWKTSQRHPSRVFAGSYFLDFPIIPATIPIEAHDSYECVASLLSGGDWKETREYSRLMRNVALGMVSNTKGLTSIAEVDDYFERLSEIVADIQVSGYRSQDELNAADGDEIRVILLEDRTYAAVGGGTHRLAAAHLLGISRIPVIVKAAAAGSVTLSELRSGGLERQVIRQLP